jgi:hypothetical protein
MNTILVWILITVGGYNGNEVSYSPPMADLESCQRLKNSFNELRREGSRWSASSQCVQIRILK